MPAVVLVAQRDQLGLGRREAERALEVAVEAEPSLRGARARSADRPRRPRSIRCERAPGSEQSSLTTQIQSVVGLRSQRVDLGREQRRVGLEGGHADGDQVLRGRRAERWSRSRGATSMRPEHEPRAAPSAQPASAELHRSLPGRARRDRHRSPEAAPAGRGSRGIRRGARRGAALPSTAARGRRRAPPVEARAVAEHRRRAADGQRRRERALEGRGRARRARAREPILPRR